MIRVACLFCLLCLLVLTSSVGHSQEPTKNENVLKTGPDVVPNVPKDAFLYATIHVKEIVSMPELKLVPWEILFASCADTFGIDPTPVERLDLYVRFEDDQLGPLVRYVVVAKTTKPLEVEQDVLLRYPLSVAHLNERFTLIGDFPSMKLMVNDAPADGELKKQLARFPDNAPVWAVFVAAPMQDFVDRLVAEVPEHVRPQAETLLRKTKMLATRVDLKDQALPIVLETANEADAIVVEKLLKDAFNEMEAISAAQFEVSKQGLPKSVDAALVRYYQRYKKELESVSQLNRNGTRLTAKLTQDYWEISQMGTNMTLVATALKALQTILDRSR